MNYFPAKGTVVVPNARLARSWIGFMADMAKVSGKPAEVLNTDIWANHKVVLLNSHHLWWPLEAVEPHKPLETSADLEAMYAV